MLLFKKCSTSTTFWKIQELNKVKCCYDLKWFLRRWCLLSKFYAFACAEQLHESITSCKEILMLCLVPFSHSANVLSDLKLAVQQGWRRTLWCKVVGRFLTISDGQKELLLSRTLEDLKFSLLSLYHHHYHHHLSSCLWVLLSFPFCVDSRDFFTNHISNDTNYTANKMLLLLLILWPIAQLLEKTKSLTKMKCWWNIFWKRKMLISF